ncbi:SGNH/GDSL hydrolase family protein, partial [Klebsiella pneumoniae]|nr:SGNH/GDSL hydrolase family protein [Klebsiella pneumoniae]
PVPLNTFHWDARHFSLLEPGNRTRQEEAGNGEAVSSRLLLESVLIQPESEARTLVVIGDSMVDGNGVGMDTYGRWTDYLAERFIDENIAVVNAGQSGSRLLKDGIG